MIWRNHAIFTASLLLINDQPWPAVLVATLASSWPDRIESIFGWRHRGVSHWPGLWLALLGVSYWIRDTIVAYVLYWVAIGSLTHILADFLSKSGVPLLWPHRNVRGLGLFRVGSFAEQMFIVFWLALCVAGLLIGWFPLHWSAKRLY